MSFAYLGKEFQTVWRSARRPGKYRNDEEKRAKRPLDINVAGIGDLSSFHQWALEFPHDMRNARRPELGSNGLRAPSTRTGTPSRGIEQGMIFG